MKATAAIPPLHFLCLAALRVTPRCTVNSLAKAIAWRGKSHGRIVAALYWLREAGFIEAMAPTTKGAVYLNSCSDLHAGNVAEHVEQQFQAEKNRTPNHYYKGAKRAAVDDEPRKERTCLCCRSKFMSSHVGNRMCPRCLERS